MANVSNVNSYDGTPDNDSISGTSGADTLSGASGADTIRGQDDNDILAGGLGNDEIYGGGGNDSMSGGAGDDYSEGGTGQNTINGGDGFDTLSYFSSTAPMVITLGGSVAGSATNSVDINDTLVSIESVRGSLLADTMTGSSFSETFEGRTGNDSIDGRDGTDRLAFSRATAGVYVDLVAGVSKDRADAFNGTTADAASVGVDTFTNIERVEGSQYDDYLSALTMLDNGFLGFGVTPDAGNVSTSRSTYNVIAGGRGDDTIIGNGNTEVNFNFFSATAGVVVDLKAGTAESTWSGSDKLYGAFSNVIGTKFDDVIRGDNILLGGEGFNGLAGNDTFVGGGGYDYINYSTSLSAVQVDLDAGDVVGGTDMGTDSLSGIEGIIGSAFNDLYDATNFGFFATNTNAPDDGLFNSMEGRGGNDTILGNGATRIVVQSNNAGVWINSLEGRAMDLADYQNGTTLDAAGVGVDTFSGVNSLRGGAHADVLIGGNRAFDQLEMYEGRAGNDTIDGGSGYDRVSYRNDARTGGFIDGTDGTLLFGYDENGDQIYTTGIDVRMAEGIVVGDELFTGTDLLRGIESVRGTVSADRYDATGFGANSANAGSNGFMNDFEGSAGNDTITGNGHTRLRYSGATAAVYVNLDANESLDLVDKNTAGSTADLAMIGNDVLGTGINSIVGSKYNDLLIGGRAANDLMESYEGGQGNDTMSGASGFDRVRYNTAASRSAWIFDGQNLKMLDDGLVDSPIKFTQGVTVNLAAGTVVGDANWIGTDTLLGIESVFGTILADSYNATGFNSLSENAGANGSFNEFQGFAGDDRVIGNGNTRVSYVDAYAGVFVDLARGTSSGLAAGDVAFVGTDTISGVSAVRGSAFGDVLIGSSEGDILEGMGGDDSITGGAGNDRINGGAGRDVAVYAGDLSSIISIGRSADGLSTIIRTTNEGTDTLTNIESIQFDLAPVMTVQDALQTLRQAPVFSSVRADVNVATSDGMESNEESAVGSEGAAAQAIDASSAFLMPEVYTGPVAGIDYQLIDTTPDSVIVGSTFNDFIVLQGTGNKAVDGGGGNNVIDGGTGSTFITGGGAGGADTFFLDGRAPGTSWSTITDFELGLDRATIWGWKEGVSSVLAVDAEGGASGYTGLTLHFQNLLPDGSAQSDTNPNLNSITLSGKTLADFGVSSLEELNAQIANQTNDHFRVDKTVDQLGDHGYLYIS